VDEDKTLAFNVALWTAAAGAMLFLFKLVAGYFIANLSIELSQRRLSATEEGKDYLVITVKLTKGDRSTLTLHDIRLQLFQTKDVTIWAKDGIPRNDGKQVPLADNRRFKFSLGGAQPTRPSLDFSVYDERTPVLQMTPGEVTHFDAIAEVSSADTVKIELAILGRTLLMNSIASPAFFENRGVGQWRASVISLPREKAAVSKGAHGEKNDKLGRS
jgi:hypothetical protein